MIIFKKYGHRKTRLDYRQYPLLGSWACKHPRDIINDVKKAMDKIREDHFNEWIPIPRLLHKTEIPIEFKITPETADCGKELNLNKEW